MNVAVAADHAGLMLKRSLAEAAQGWGFRVLEVGPHDDPPTDESDAAEAVGGEILAGRAERGIVICDIRVGANVAANKLPGIRAALCHDFSSARLGVEQDDMNVLVLGAGVIDADMATEITRCFLCACFDDDQQHVQRLTKVRDLERRYSLRDLTLERTSP